MTNVIIVAGGGGSRMGGAQPKQFMMLDGVPVIVRTIRRFIEALPDARIVVAMKGSSVEQWEAVRQEYLSQSEITVCEGGESRFHSVKNALAHASSCDYIVIHDAARPFVSREMITYVLAQAQEYGHAVPVTELSDSMRILDGDASKWVDRQNFRALQTPQIFSADMLQNAYNQRYDPLFTDDSSVVERLGVKIHLCQGERTNIKLTHPSDMALAQVILSNEKKI